MDEKIPYALDDLKALSMAGCIAYAGKGFSKGVLHMLEASPYAAARLPVRIRATHPPTRGSSTTCWPRTSDGGTFS